MNYSLRFFAPLITGSLAGLLCPMSSSNGVEVKARPPATVFKIVWPILYLLLGFSWDRLSQLNLPYTDIVYGILNLALGAWLVVYSCYKQQLQALYVIYGILGLVITTQSYAMKFDTLAGLILAPLLIWMLLATQLSWTAIHQTVTTALPVPVSMAL